MKVFAYTSGKPLAVPKSYAELLRENEELRRKEDELEIKLARRQSCTVPR